MPAKQQPRKPFNLLLDLTEYDMLWALSAASGQSCGSVLRSALRSRYAMAISCVPTCASGNPCFVPQMHVPPLRNTVAGPSKGHQND